MNVVFITEKFQVSRRLIIWSDRTFASFENARTTLFQKSSHEHQISHCACSHHTAPSSKQKRRLQSRSFRKELEKTRNVKYERYFYLHSNHSKSKSSSILPRENHSLTFSTREISTTQKTSINWSRSGHENLNQKWQQEPQEQKQSNYIIHKRAQSPISKIHPPLFSDIEIATILVKDDIRRLRQWKSRHVPYLFIHCQSSKRM